MPERGEVWLTDLDPRRGTEPGKTRPVLIVQSQACWTPATPQRSSSRSPRTSMNYPAASCGVSARREKNLPEGVTPECINRGSSPGLAWIPA